MEYEMPNIRRFLSHRASKHSKYYIFYCVKSTLGMSTKLESTKGGWKKIAENEEQIKQIDNKNRDNRGRRTKNKKKTK